MKEFSVNDWVVYQKQEASAHPVKGARAVYPSKRGDNYDYLVDRLWQVTRVSRDGIVEARGPSGNTHRVRASDPHLQKAGWFRRQMRRHVRSTTR